jgi:peptidoglycan/LPS O-acetylase OafA/YrhL
MLAAILAIGFAQVPFSTYPRFNLSILEHVQYFLTGLLVADVFVLDLDRMKSSWAWDIAGALMVAVIFWPEHDASWPHIVLPVPMCVLFLSAMRSRALRLFFANQWIAVIGGMCYSIYLLHFVWIAILFRVTRHFILPGANFLENFLIQLVTVGLPVLAVSAGYFILVERPCMDPDWPGKLWQRISGQRVPEVVALDSGGITD